MTVARRVDDPTLRRGANHDHKDRKEPAMSLSVSDRAFERERIGAQTPQPPDPPVTPPDQPPPTPIPPDTNPDPTREPPQPPTQPIGDPPPGPNDTPHVH
jgi:hypothetical protein